MCGIAGIAAATDCPIDPDRLGAMIAMLAHRGPDDVGVRVDGRVGLAHARLSIIDVAAGRQPMANDDGSICLTFNGEIFNFIELREELARNGHRFRTRSDTEVLLRLYEQEGEDAIARLNGQWAIALWDSRTRTLLLSRDRLGIRPLFYTLTNGMLLFASEIKALFADPAVSREIDPEGLDNVLTFWSTLPPRTVFKGIREVPPGHVLAWRDGAIDVIRHWQPRFAPDDVRSMPESERVAALEQHLIDATRRRLRADVPVGAYVSGGLDSSLIAALARKVAREPLTTFSIAFDDERFDEGPAQREVAAALGTTHHEIRCTSADIDRVFPDVVWHAEQPLLRTAPAPMFLLSRVVREAGFKVVLTGEGADELFGGYDIFKEAKIRRFWARFPDSPRRPLLLRRLYPYLPELQRQSDAYLRTFFHVSPGDLADPCFSHLPRWRMTSSVKLFFSDRVRSSLAHYDSGRELRSRLPEGFNQWDGFCQAQHLELAYLLPGYILSSQGDRAAMAHGVEARFPFLDPEVAAFAMTLPSRLKMKVLDEKYLLRCVARHRLPESIRTRRKQPYRAPGAEVFFGPRRSGYVDDLLSPAQVRADGIFQPDAVKRLVRKLRDGRAAGARDTMALVAILSTQLLADRFINHFGTRTHGHAYAGASSAHHG